MKARWIVLGLLLVAFAGGSRAQAAEFVRVAMVPITVHSASGDSDYLSKGLMDMLSARLERAGNVHVVRLSDGAAVGTDTGAAVEAGRAAGAEYVVFGSFTQFGKGASLDVRCAEVGEAGGDGSPESRRVFIQSGDLSEIIPRLDGLAGKMTLFLNGESAAPATASKPAAAPSGAAMLELQRRIAELEKAVFASEPAAAEEPAAPAE